MPCGAHTQTHTCTSHDVGRCTRFLSLLDIHRIDERTQNASPGVRMFPRVSRISAIKSHQSGSWSLSSCPVVLPPTVRPVPSVVDILYRTTYPWTYRTRDTHTIGLARLRGRSRITRASDVSEADATGRDDPTQRRRDETRYPTSSDTAGHDTGMDTGLECAGRGLARFHLCSSTHQ